MRLRSARSVAVGSPIGGVKRPDGEYIYVVRNGQTYEYGPTGVGPSPHSGAFAPLPSGAVTLRGGKLYHET